MDLRLTAKFFCGVARISCALLLAGGAIGVARAESPGPLEVIGYSSLDESGPSKSWSLAGGLPYLYVPYVGDDVNGGIARLRMGAEVGAALFQKPFFASRDRGCARDLGSDSRPDLQWLGPTARFEPGGDGMSPDAIAAPDQKTDGYASMILFRKDLGPPPGVLLMNRRRTLGTRCVNAIHKTFFNRVFMPVAAAPERLRCFNLAGEFQIEGSAPQSFRFPSSDRLVLLVPSELSERYRGIRHRFATTLYDHRDCTGEAVSFHSGSLARGTTKLGDFGFRDRTRSVKITYVSGPLSAYMTPEAAPIAPIVAESPEPAPVPVSESAPQPAPEPAPEPEVAAQAPEPVPEPEVTAKLPEAAPIQAPDATPVTATPRPLPEIKWDPPAPAAPVQSAAVPAAIPTAATVSPAAEASPSPATASQAQPKLEPVLAPETQAVAGLASQTFAYPVHQVYRLNFCLNSKRDCGEPAAQAWCKTQGFGTASAWKIDENIGSLFPTVVLGEDRICAQFVCDGFQEITCAK